jgi:hypothetical protein
MSESWRDIMRPIIGKVIETHGTSDMGLLRAKLRRAFPCGPRKYHPYKIWLDEIRVQLGMKKKPRRAFEPKPLQSAADQKPLFE